MIKTELFGSVSHVVAEAEAEISRIVGYEVVVNYQRADGKLGKDYLTTRRDRILELIISTVCEVISLPKVICIQKNNFREYSEARQIISYLAKDVYRVASPKKIGQRLGNRERTTILSQAKTAQNLIDTDKRFRQTVELCKAEIDILLQLSTP